MAVNILLKRSSTASKRPVGASMAFGELNLNYDAATGGIFYKDSNGDVVKVGPCQVSSVAPNSTPAGSAGNSEGEFWYDTATNTLKLWDGSTWVETGGAVQGVTGVAPIVVDNTDPLNPIVSIDYATTSADGSVELATDAETQAGTDATLAVTPASLQSKVSDSVSTNSSFSIASSAAVKTAYDLADAALPKSGGTMTGDISFADAGEGVIFSNLSKVSAISDSISTTSSVTAASSTAVKSAYDLADAALARSGGTMTGTITFAAGQTFPVSGIQDATTGQKGVVQIGTNIDVAAGVISVATATTTVLGLVSVGSNIEVSGGEISVLSATTTQPGVVQLNDTTASTSTTEALTANQGRFLQEQIDALAITSNITLAGTFNATTGLVDNVTAAGTAVGFADGSPLPTPSAANEGYFVIVDVQGTNGPNSPTLVHIGDWFLSDASTWLFLDVGFQAPYASTTVEGVVLLATDAEVQAGVNTDHAVTPSGLQSKVSDSVTTTSSTTLASSTAVKTAKDAADAAQATADAALPKAGGTMTGNITFQDAGEGVVFSDSSAVYAISDSVSTTSSTTAASSTAVKTAYDLADTIYNGTFNTTARPTAQLLQTSSTVAAADQLGLVVDSSDGQFYSVEFFDGGTY